MLDISISNNKKLHKGNPWLASKNRGKRLRNQEVYLGFIGNKKKICCGSFNELNLYQKAKNNPAKSVYELEEFNILKENI